MREATCIVISSKEWVCAGHTVFKIACTKVAKSVNGAGNLFAKHSAVKGACKRLQDSFAWWQQDFPDSLLAASLLSNALSPLT